MTKRKRKWNRPIRGLFTYASGGPVWRVYFGSFIGRILSGAFFLSTIYESMKTDVLRPRPTIRRRPRFHGCFSALDVVTNRTACFFFCFFPATVDIVRTKSPKREATDKKKHGRLAGSADAERSSGRRRRSDVKWRRITENGNPEGGWVGGWGGRGEASHLHTVLDPPRLSVGRRRRRRTATSFAYNTTPFYFGERTATAIEKLCVSCWST